jgi:hypothetical protein
MANDYSAIASANTPVRGIPVSRYVRRDGGRRQGAREQGGRMQGAEKPEGRKARRQKSPKAEKPEGLTSEEVSYIKGDNRFVRRIR